MYKIIVYGLGELKLRILSAIERRKLILLAYIDMSPVIKWLNIVHTKVLLCKDRTRVERVKEGNGYLKKK